MSSNISTERLPSETTDRLPAATTKRWKPRRGIRLFKRPTERKSSFGVMWRVDGARRVKFFETEKDQIGFAKDLQGGVESHGLQALRLDTDEANEWRTFRAQIGTDIPLDDVVACWLAHGKKRATLTVREGVAQYLAAKEAEGVAKATMKHYKPVFTRLETKLGNTAAGDVTREDLAAWVAGLKMAPESVRTCQKRIRSLFLWLKINRKISENPCEGLRPVKIVAEEVEIMPVADVLTLFEKNEPTEQNGLTRELCGRLALEFFCGLRFSSAAQVVDADIQFTDRGIALPARKIKTRRREFIDGLPENLWQWLTWAKPAEWSMTTRQYALAKTNAFVRAGVAHPHNCARHSFASYHVAANKDASKTSLILCHQSPKMLWSNYKGKATAADGVAYFEIVPPA